MAMQSSVSSFFHQATNTITHVVRALEESAAVIIDSVLDFDAKSGRTGTEAADTIIDFVRRNDLSVEWILETHVHADHLTAAPYLKEKLGGQIGVGAGITVVQEGFSKIFNTGSEFTTDGSQFDRLFADGERVVVGPMTIEILHTPGHTPACVTYVIGDAAFVGDTIFMPDFGTARTDFPGGDAAALYRSINRILSLSPEARLFMCHDYGPGGREYKWETTVAEERAQNVHIRDGISEEQFIKTRTERDGELSMPALLLPSVQVNMRAGKFPPVEDNGVSYLKLPLDAL
jgi:glyoxylase-like metal-dependent hydrolase (beta-lactamase superfamily II)